MATTTPTTSPAPAIASPIAPTPLTPTATNDKDDATSMAIPSITNPNRPVPTFQRGNPDDLANISTGAIVGAVVVVVLVVGSIGALVLRRRRNQQSGSGR